jgi:hypothetical protein
MSFLALLGFGGGEIILIGALMLLLIGAKKLPELADAFRQGMRESDAVLMALTVILGTMCLVLVLYEFSK